MLSILNDGRVHLLDGGMGTMLQGLGLKPGTPPENWNIENPQAVLSVHQAYRAAGCEIITANTFGANGLKHADANELVRAGVRIAKAAGGLTAADIGPLGRLMAPFGDLSFDDAAALFAQMALSGAQAGADLIIIETMTDFYELKAAVTGAKEACTLPIFASFSVQESGRLLTGGTIRGAAAALEALGVSAIGLNCSLGPDKMRPLIGELARATRLPVFAMPNAGLPVMEEGRAHYRVTPEAFAEETAAMLESGASLLGGCCGTTPAHLKALTKLCKGRKAQSVTRDSPVFAASRTKILTFDEPFLIGERINPANRPDIQAALREGDFDTLADEACEQKDAGASALDVCVSCEGADEPEALAKAVTAIQTVCDLPLFLDSLSLEALEKAARACLGKPVFNSSTCEQNILADKLALAKKCGAALTILPMDDQGVPKTPQARLRLALRALDIAKEVGFPLSDLCFDALVTPSYASPLGARAALDTVALLKANHLRVLAGVSNVSHGMPRRGALNAAFLSMALFSGLDAAIINPLQAETRAAFSASLAMLGDSDAAAEYARALL